MNAHSLNRIMVIVLGLSFLSGCEWFKKNSKKTVVAEGEEVLLTIKGSPAISVTEFEAFYDQILEQQPQLRQFAAMMPDLKMNVFTTLMNQKLIEQWAVDNNVDKRPEYQTDRKMLLENVERGLAIKYFQLEHPVHVSDHDVKKYYDENKDTIYLMSPAGISASGVSFTNETAAHAFLATVDKPGVDFAQQAARQKLTVKQFGRINEQNSVEPALKEKILAFKKFPSTNLVVVDKTYWVINAKSKDEAKHYPFDQAKDDARNRLTTERTGDMFNKELAKLKDHYQVVEFKKYFEDHKKHEAQEAGELKAANQAVSANKEQPHVS
jgi:hypothetical protein